MKLTERERTNQLGCWGESKAASLLKKAKFSAIRDLNKPKNHKFADIYAERNGVRYVIGVKTRNKFQASGPLNPTYNIQKKGADIDAVAKKYKAELAWVALPVIPEIHTYWAYFGTMAQIVEKKERYSIPMKESDVLNYECLADEEIDASLLAAWSNGG